MWGADGSGGVGLLSAAGDRLDVKFAYDVVFSPSNTNEQVCRVCLCEVQWATPRQCGGHGQQLQPTVHRKPHQTAAGCYCKRSVLLFRAQHTTASCSASVRCCVLQVFDQVAWPAIEPVLQGISGTVFAYGVTSRWGHTGSNSNPSSGSSWQHSALPRMSSRTLEQPQQCCTAAELQHAWSVGPPAAQDGVALAACVQLGA